MRKILGFTIAVMLVYGSVLAQKIPVEFSAGIGGYFPHDGRYAQFFNHNPANWSVQGVYKWSALDLKAGFDQMRKRTNRTNTSFDQRPFSKDGLFVDSIATASVSSFVNSYLRASTFRFGGAFHPFREAGFSPFLGFGGSVSSSKGYGHSVLSTDSTVIYADNTPSRMNSDADTSTVAPFSESVFGTYLEAGVQAQLPHNFFFIFEAIRDFRPKDKAGVLGPAKGGGTLVGIRLGYRF